MAGCSESVFERVGLDSSNCLLVNESEILFTTFSLKKILPATIQWLGCKQVDRRLTFQEDDLLGTVSEVKYLCF